MKTKWFLGLSLLLATFTAKAQFFLDCSCLSTQSVLITNACQAVVPDLCQFTNCWASTIVPPVPLTCSQTPPAGTPVGPGSYGITVTITDPNGTQQACALIFTVNPPPGAVSLVCAANKTVECGTPWIFDPPTATNVCCPIAGVPGGAIVFLSSLVTNGTCPAMITATWQVFDGCMLSATCTQLVTVVDTTAPVMNCICLTNGLNPLSVPMTVTNCQDFIPDLCALATLCTVEACGPLHCSQTPPPGTPVGPGVHPITITMLDCALNAAACTVNFTVVSPVNGPFALLCAPNKTVPCGGTWIFDPPVATNTCCPIAGVPGGVILTVLSTVTNGACPQIITITWKASDGCGAQATCSQTVTVVDTVPPILTCVCITNSAAIPVSMTVTQCNSTIPDLCLAALTCSFDACGVVCSQTPPAGTSVGPGVHPITVTVTDCAGNSASCTFNYTVISPGPFGLVCAPNKTVECGTTWTFDPPTATNNCCPVAGTSSGVTVLSVTTFTNGFCPQVITRTWTVKDGCDHTVSCSQIVTVVDTTPPALNCNCLSSTAGNPLLPPLIVTACLTNIPDLCPAALSCATDNCGPLTCSQTPAAGTIVGPGSYNITVTITDCAGNSVSCTVHFTVYAPLTGCCLTPPGGMVAWWPLDELTGATLFADATGNGHTALVESGGPVGSPFSPTAVAGVVAGANYFYGLAPRGRAVNAPLLNFGLGSFSADCWVNPIPTGVIHWHPIVDKLNQTGPTTGFGYTVGLLNQRVVLKVGDGTLYTYTSVGTVSYNAWGFVAVAVNRTANTVTFHVNGVTEAPQPLIPAGNFNSTIDVLIGSTWNNNIALGELAVDELELFSLALGANDMNALWNANSFGKCKTNTCVVSIFCPTNRSTTAICGQTCATVNYPAPLVANGVLTGCAPPSGTCFPIGVNTVTCTAASPCGPPAACSFIVTVLAPTNCCDSQTNVWNTGMGGGTALPPGTPDPNYVLVSAPPGGCTGPAQVLLPSSLPVGPWVANGPNSQWIGGGPTAACDPGVYHYRRCFYLSCTDGASIIGQWAVDDHGAIHLNGLPTGNSVPSLQYPNLPGYGWFPVSITNGFVCGMNCLDFYVTNANIGINPTGFRAELTNVFNDCCCGPAQTLFTVNSGQNNGGLLPSGAPDNQFALTCAPPGVTTTIPVVVNPHPIWVPNGPNSLWIGPNQFNNAPAGVYCYTMNFVIPCPPGTPIKASLTGQWSADDTGTIHLNGNPTGNTLPNGWAFLNWQAINITSGFVSGLNSLTFYVTNAGGPTGLRLELTGSASCCDCTNPPDCSCNFTNGNFDTFVPANGTGGGWTTSGVFGGAGWQAAGGNPGGTFLLNNVGDPATDPTISQTLCCLQPGQCYTIHGQRKVQAWFGQLQPSFAVLLDGVPILSLPVPSNPADANWYDFSVSFTATNACQTIGFASEINGTDVSYWIDNIRLECCQTNSCFVCPQLNQTVVGCPPIMPNFTTNSFAGPGCTPIGPLVVTQNIPPGTPLIPGTTTVVIIRVCDANGTCRDCDVVIRAVSTAGMPVIHCPQDRVLLTCSNSATAYYAATASGHVGPVVCVPPSGTVLPLGTHLVTCTATNQCGAAATCSFNIAVRPQRPRWLCPWIAVGISATPLGQAQLVSRPNLGSSGQDGVSIDNLGSSGQDGVRLDFGSAQDFTFSTVLDFEAAEGATIELALPPDPANPGGTTLLSFMRKSGPKGYCVKTNKRLISDDPSASYRSIAVGTNGDLFSSFLWQTNDMDTNVLLNIYQLPGVTSVVMTVTIDCLTREVSLEFPHCIWTPDLARKGWDGCIYGNHPRRTSKLARLVLTPVTTMPIPPITTLDLRGVNVPSLIFEDPSIGAGGRKWGDGHVTLMKAYDDAGERGLEFLSLGDGGGVRVDLGYTASFDMRLQHFENGDIPEQEQLLTRTIGPIRGLTNRPPPPFLDAMLLQASPGGVDCSVDFSNLGSPTVHVLIYNGGVLVAQRAGVAADLSQPVLTLPTWPDRLGKLGGGVSCRRGKIPVVGLIRLPGGAGLPEEVFGDEFRVLAELAPGAPHPDFYSGFDVFASAGADWGITQLQTTSALTPGPVTIERTPAGVRINGITEGFILQGAERVTGPWYDLIDDDHVTLPDQHSLRVYLGKEKKRPGRESPTLAR